MSATKLDIDAFLKSINQDYLPRAHAAMARGLNVFAATVLDEARRLCPRDTGFLQDTSPFIEPTSETGPLNVTIGFNASYALYVHENLEAHHPKGGQAKFLEVAMRTAQPELAGFLLETLQKEFA